MEQYKQEFIEFMVESDVLKFGEIDGAIVGSYFIRLLEEQGFAPEAAETYCRTFKKELNA